MTSATKKQPLSLYIHVPFCLRKCDYCDFYSVAIDDALASAYKQAVLRAIDQLETAAHYVDTIYFGGGTPILLPSDFFDDVLSLISRKFALQSPEITIEANPAATLSRKLGDLRGAGVNRISFGVQSMLNSELAALGRLHSANDATIAINAAIDAGFANISADLMLGIPHQTLDSLAATINALTALPITHISGYMLKIEDATPFAASGIERHCPDEDMTADMYQMLYEMLMSSGFEQYEISNFAKNGAVSKHNLKYWNCDEYVGIGPSAHSFVAGKRYYYPRDLQSFLTAENPQSLQVFDSIGGDFDEYAMLRLRLSDGLNLDYAEKKYNANLDRIRTQAETLAKNGLATLDDNVIKLTTKGFLLSNTVIATLLQD